MIGAIIGDVAGSRFEWDNHKSKNFELFTPACSLTDDSILSLALARAVLETKDNRDDLPSRAVFCMQKLGRQYPDAGYGELFIRWLGEEDPSPYQSYGNGSAMRVSPAAWAGSSLEEVLRLTDQITAVTHDHPEGMKGAEAVAAAIYLARSGKKKEEKAPAPVKAVPAPAEAALEAAPAEETDDLELIAVISAAIAASEQAPADGFVVRSIRRRGRKSNWRA